MSRIRILAFMTLAAPILCLFSACAPATPEERVAKLRSRYEARVNGFYVEAIPEVEEVAEDTPGEAEDGVVASEEETGSEPEVVVAQNAHLDLIVQHDSDEMLAGLTIDITMVDATQMEKGSWRLWVDTSTLRKANQLQFVHVLEDVPYVEGDGFAAEVRGPIQPEEYGEYVEFSSSD